MNNSKLTRDWYSKDSVKDILVPSLSTWRSRYDLKEQLLLNDNTLVIRNLRYKDMVPNGSPDDILHIVTSAEAYRPDIIAKNVYNNASLAWIILAANNLSDVFDLTADLEITIPSPTTLYQTGGVLTR